MKALYIPLLLLLLLIENLSGQENSGFDLSYDLPAGAQKVGPITTRDFDVTYYNYFLPGTDFSRENMVGRESYFKGQLIDRELFKPYPKDASNLFTTLHGVRQTWHRSGVKASESPYRNGKMDGLFRVWNEAGQLIGQYMMHQGTGTKRIYNSDGALQREEHFEQGRATGVYFALLQDGEVALLWKKDGHSAGSSFKFDKSDEIGRVTCYSPEGGLHGPALSFSQSGAVVSTTWYVNESKVSESEYKTAASTDATLPPYNENPARYKELATPEVKAVLKKYRNAPRVKIPLEFDTTGDPVLAQPR
jgi:antitoxin component YwqK of YwqJK toxin-antitoxin module